MKPPKRVAVVVALGAPLLLAAGSPTARQTSRDATPERTAQLEAALRRGELRLARIQSDDAFPGRHHLRYEQRIAGARVFGAQVVQQVDADGRSLSVFGDFIGAGGTRDATPSIDVDQAAAIAATVLPSGARAAEVPELVWLADRAGLRLVWTTRVRHEVAIERVFVDAATGAVLSHYSDLRTDATVGLGRGVW